MTKYLLFLALILIGISCINMNDPENQASYIQARKSYPDSMVNHIPKKLPNNHIGYSCTWFDNKYSNSGIDLKIQYKTKKEFYEFRSKYANSNILKSDNPCILRILSPHRVDKTPTFNNSCDRHYPVPEYIYDFRDFENKYFETIILNFEPGIFKSEENLSEKYEYPLYWLHGYSQGITFYEEQLIISYWLIIW